MDFLPSTRCYNIVNPLYYVALNGDCGSALESDDVKYLLNYCDEAGFWEVENKLSKPMVWIGIYIVVASVWCIIAMGADLLHGFRNKKMWFPSKYFTLNAASITVITVTMKLPVDLSSLMTGYLDQATKLGSMAFMCTMMANLMPSLASMDNQTLLANVVGLTILVITIVVNICIEISTGVINDSGYYLPKPNYSIYLNSKTFAYIYVAMLLWLLVLMISLAITIPSSKRILDFKYQVTSKRTLDDQDNISSIAEKLRQCVGRYWVMAETGSPQYVMASNQLSSTAGIICVIIVFMELLMMVELKDHLYMAYRGLKDVFVPKPKWGSDYKWSMGFILVVQLIGIVVSSIAPLFRCFNILKYNLYTNCKKNHFMVFKVEKYWIHKLHEWQESHITFLSSGSWSTTLIRDLKNFILELCIGIQMVIVISSKMMGLIPLVFSIVVVYSSYSWKLLVAMLFTVPIVPTNDDVIEDLGDYVLQLDNEMELGNTTLNSIFNAMNNFIRKAEKEQSNDLLVFLETSNEFKGVENFDNDHVEPLTSIKLVNSWSLPIVTLTCIALSLPNIPQIAVNRLLKNIRESLQYTHLVEEIINNANEYEYIRNATITLWHEVEEKCTWLKNTIGKSTFQGKTSVEILEWFAKKAEEIIIKINNTRNGEIVVNTPKNLILANSMHRVARTILLHFQMNVGLVNEKELFEHLSSMIADILCACFTNIPRAIEMKCRETAIEKRESSVMVAAKLFGRTEKIIKRLEVLELPRMDPEKMGLIDEWRLHLKQLIP